MADQERDPSWDAIADVILSVRGKPTKYAAYASLGPGRKALFAFHVLHGHAVHGYAEFLFHVARFRELGFLGELLRAAEFFRDEAHAAALRAIIAAPVPSEADYAAYLRTAEAHKALMSQRLATDPAAFVD